MFNGLMFKGATVETAPETTPKKKPKEVITATLEGTESNERMAEVTLPFPHYFQCPEV